MSPQPNQEKYFKDKIQQKDILSHHSSILLGSWKSTGSLRNCHSQEESKEKWQLSVMWYLDGSSEKETD